MSAGPEQWAATAAVAERRVQVVTGRPSTAELAAAVAAVSAAVAAGQRLRDAGTAHPSTPAWRRAALAEGVGGPRTTGPDELTTGRW